MNRSQQKRITHQAKIVRHMRKTRGLSMNEAGRLVKVTGSAIAHMEQGRMDISRERLKSLVLAYGYSMQDFLEFIDGKSIPISYRDECIAIVRQLDEPRLAAVYAILTTFAPNSMAPRLEN
jgi:transcriptional regulator with XRE-family HTH domain